MPLRIEDVPRVIPVAIKLRKNIVLFGPPGIGKTVSVEDYVRRFAEENGLRIVDGFEVEVPEPCNDCITYVYLNINAASVVDVSGVPDKASRDGTTVYRWIPLSAWLQCRLSKYCLVFIDEFNTTDDPDKFSYVMRLLGECRAGSVNLGCGERPGGGWGIVIAAGNPPGTNKVAREVPAPLFGGKVWKVDVEAPTIRAWISYMHDKYGNDWEPRVAAFLLENPHMFAQLPPDRYVTDAYPTPRGWDAVARLCKMGMCDEEHIAGFVGREAAASLVASLKTSPPDLDTVLAAPDDELPIQAMLYAARGGLCKDAEDPRVRALFERLSSDDAAIITFLAGPLCPEKMTPIYGVLSDLGKLRGVASTRAQIAEAVVEAQEEVELW